MFLIVISKGTFFPKVYPCACTYLYNVCGYARSIGEAGLWKKWGHNKWR